MERKQYYREEWSEKDIPKFIEKTIHDREFGFDHYGRGPNDRYRVFHKVDYLRKFIRYRAPFAAYCSVALYNKPGRREGWRSSELVFDVDAKDIPLRICKCENVCEKCLKQAQEIVSSLIDTLRDDFGLDDMHVIYSGRGYHLRVLDPHIMVVDSEVRGQIVRYLVGSDVPRNEFISNGIIYRLEHFSIPFGYPQVFTERMKYAIQYLDRESELEGVTPKLLKDTLKYRELLEKDKWGVFRRSIGPQRYQKLLSAITTINLGLVDAKVTIDLKRILRLPSSLHSGVSMKCMEVKNIETFDPFQDAVPRFVREKE